MQYISIHHTWILRGWWFFFGWRRRNSFPSHGILTFGLTNQFGPFGSEVFFFQIVTLCRCTSTARFACIFTHPWNVWTTLYVRNTWLQYILCFCGQIHPRWPQTREFPKTRSSRGSKAKRPAPIPLNHLDIDREIISKVIYDLLAPTTSDQYLQIKTDKSWGDAIKLIWMDWKQSTLNQPVSDC